MKLDGSFEGSDKAVAAALLKKGPAAIASAVTTVNAQATRLQGYIVVTKLDNHLLHIRSGKLAGSVRVDPEAKAVGGSIYADVVGGGGLAWYGKLHEYGGAKAYIVEAVNKKALAFFMGGKKIIVKRVKHPPMPERSFMRSSLNELRESIATRIKAVIAKVFSN